LSGEEHVLSANGAKREYVDFETVTLEKLLNILRNQDMESDELFDMCDVNNDGGVSITELRQTVSRFDPDLLIKEKACIKKFFGTYD
jgi:Ca2+-binding EF-hand superfamily protein